MYVYFHFECFKCGYVSRSHRRIFNTSYDDVSMTSYVICYLSERDDKHVFVSQAKNLRTEKKQKNFHYVLMM